MERKYKWIPFFGMKTYTAEQAREILFETVDSNTLRNIEGMRGLVFMWFDFEWIAVAKVKYKNAD